jgi:hypothetical protein
MGPIGPYLGTATVRSNRRRSPLLSAPATVIPALSVNTLDEPRKSRQVGAMPNADAVFLGYQPVPLDIVVTPQMRQEGGQWFSPLGCVTRKCS